MSMPIKRKIYVNKDTDISQLIYPDITFTWIIKNTELGEMQYGCIDNADLAEVMAHAKKNEVQCSYCGKWVTIDKAHHHCPAGCSCNKCYDKARKAESEFLDQLD